MSQIFQDQVFQSKAITLLLLRASASQLASQTHCHHLRNLTRKLDSAVFKVFSKRSFFYAKLTGQAKPRPHHSQSPFFFAW